MLSEVISREVVDYIVRKTIHLVKNNYRTIENKHGWHQLLGTNKIGNVGTAQALLCFHYSGEDFSDKYHALDSLIRTQFTNESNETLYGGWAFVTNASAFPSTECTCWVLLSLLNDSTNKEKCMDKGITWLLANQSINGTGDLGWGTTKFDEPRVYSTALALRVLAKCGYTKAEQFVKGKTWLIRARNEYTGGWGETLGSSPTFLHTAHALISLKECGIEPSSEELQKGCNWLLQSYDPNQLWNDFQYGGLIEQMDVNAPPGITPAWQRVTFLHFTTPWVLNALITCGRRNTAEVFRGMKKLLESGRSGYWDHPFLIGKKDKPLWAIHDSLLALRNFQANLPLEWPEIKQVILKDGDGEIIIEPIGKAQKSIRQYLGRFIRSRITRVCLGIIVTVSFLMAFKVIGIQQGIWGILVPLAISVVANLLTKEAATK